MDEPRTRRRLKPVDPEGPEYVPEDVYPEDPTIYNEGPPPPDDPNPDPEIVVDWTDEIPEEGIPDEEEVYEDPLDEEPFVEPELPPEEPVESEATAKAKGKARRFPVMRVVPRIAYYQSRYAKDGKLRSRLAVVGAEHIVAVKLKDEKRHKKLGRHTFVMRPINKLDNVDQGKPKELRFRLINFYDKLGLLPDWDFNRVLSSDCVDDIPTDSTRHYTALLLLTVQRKRRERTIVIPIKRIKETMVQDVHIILQTPEQVMVSGARVRLGGLPWQTDAKPAGSYPFKAVPKSTFIVEIDPTSLPKGFGVPKRQARTVDFSDPDVGAQATITLRKT